MDEPDVLREQLSLVWRLAGEALADISDDEALWLPTSNGWTVRRSANGRWVADWSDTEPDPLPSSSIAWVQWHVLWWWSTVINRSFGDGALRREDIDWPGSQESMDAIDSLRIDWLSRLDSLGPDDLRSPERTRWPYADGRPFLHVVAWVNAELMKNVAEMAYIRRITPFYRATTPSA